MTAVLRDMQADDLPMVLSWRNSERVRMNMYTTHLISEEEHRRWWDNQSGNEQTRLLIAEIDSEAVGVVTFTHYTGPDGTASWAFYTGDKAPRGAGSQMEVAALEYAFDNLKLRKLECEVLDFNMPVVNLHLRYGFSVEGLFREAHLREDGAHDVYRLAMLASDWSRRVAPMLRKHKGGRLGLSGKTFSKTVILDRDKVLAFVEATGDKNPVHLDEEAARALGFKGCIAHGMLSGSFFSALFANDFPGPGTIYLSQSLEFTAPVPVGGEMEVSIRVLSHIGRRMRVETRVECGGKCCVAGQAELLAPKGLTLEIG